MGSIEPARRAGTKEAKTATDSIQAIEPKMRIGSAGGVLYKRLEGTLETATAPPSPAPNPIATGTTRLLHIIRTTLELVAPRAIRMPISEVRSVTLDATCPYREMHVSSNARRPRNPDSDAIMRSAEIDSIIC